LCESSEERSEEELLLSHLEQHHHLISVLKKKADDTHEHCRDLEQLKVQLEKLRAEDAVKIKTQTQRIQYLEGCFLDLVKNYEKMIQFKNEHKKQLLEAQSQQAGAHAQEVDSLKKQLQLLQERHQQAAARAEQAESQPRAQGSELQAKLERAHEEKEQLLNLAVEREKALQDKEWEIQKLEEKLETVEEAMQKAGRCLKKKAAAIDKDLQVQELQGQLERSKQAYSELLLRFDAYRKHSRDLLTKERALNVKLRHFVA
ncbi:CCD89 protein, partial [Orthonyx spaldingii]|nr:CCD89 protein [Orthonyx spaldingii]